MNLPFLETMITQTCNISCLGCTNYSDLKHSGYVSWSDGKKDIEQWLQRINIEEFGIIGGEPLVNPEWQQWVVGLRSLMPLSQLRFTTNGLLLHKYPDIIDLMESVGNIVFKITVHLNDLELENNIERIFKSRNWKSVTEYGIKRFIGDNKVRLQINRPDQFLMSYQGTYRDMKPWHSNPVDAFKICCQKTCPLLFKGKIYKCSTSGLLKETLERFNNPNINEWIKYIPQGISTNDNDLTISEFCNNFNQSHAICGQCPSDVNKGSINHLSNVFNKKTFSIKTI